MARQTSDSESKYQRIYRELLQLVDCGAYAPGDKLPAEMELAKQYGVSYLTLRQAISLLERDGVIVKQRGKGSYISDSAVRSQSSTSRVRKTIAHVFVDRRDLKEKLSAQYLTHEQVESRKLAARMADKGYSLMLSSVSSEEFSAGGLPATLMRDDIAGILVDGFVEDYHVYRLSELGVPIVVWGNARITLPVHQVYYQYYDFGYEVTRNLLNQSVGPVYLITGPFSTTYTGDIMNGYAQASMDSDRDTLVTTLTYMNSEIRELRTILQKLSGDFSLFINHGIDWYVMEQMYSEFGLSFDSHPVAAWSAGPPPDFRVNGRLSDGEGATVQAEDLLVRTLEYAISGAEARKFAVCPKVSCWNENNHLHVDVVWEVDLSAREAFSLPALT